MWIALVLLPALKAPAQAPLPAQPPSQADEIRELREAVRDLRNQVAELKQELRSRPINAAPGSAESTSTSGTQITAPAQNVVAAKEQEANGQALDFLRKSTIEVGIDTYYGYNFNNPIGRVNLLRAYDVSSNAFSLNQASLILKRDPDVASGQRFGARLDLQFGQATETLQGNAANEPRPEVYRSIFQAYGTYIFPVGSGLTIDVGKFASSLGFENNYSKDQINYSRSYWFNFLPFYHMGARANYKFNDLFAVNYWVVNGTQQTEPFNGFKDQFFGLVLQPRKTLSWNINYYLGQEHPDVIFFPRGGAPPGSPTVQGVPFQPIPDPPNGRLHIFDSYINWQSTPKLTLALEGDYIIERLLKNSAPAHVTGGAVYSRYQFTPKVALAARAEYLSDRGGLFSGVTQALKETTLTYDYKFAPGFLARMEWRHDFSNTPFFFTDRLGVLSKHQTTATMGLIWWWGNREEGW
jgi:hypothetical protein